MKILAISGSLRAESSNTALLRAAAGMAPAGVDVSLYDGLADLPHYSPERDHFHNAALGTDGSPPAARDLRAQMGAADGVLFCTPEYAYGIPGSLKNALDWVVSSGELWRKPVGVLSASPSAEGGVRAHAALCLTLSALEAEVVEQASLSVPAVRTRLGPDGGVSDPDTARALSEAVAALARAIAARHRAENS